LSWINFFVYGAYSVAGIGFLVTISSILYLNGKFKMHKRSSINYKLVLDETNV
jgi:hypothetical protein